MLDMMEDVTQIRGMGAAGRPGAAVARRRDRTDAARIATVGGAPTSTAQPGADYGFLLDDDETVLPDPGVALAARRGPRPSRLYDQAAFEWTDAGWRGRVLPGGLIYELHIGTFTAEGTFDAAIERLGHLVDLGVTHVEVLPVNAVNGEWNWGYDGVGWYAVHEPYGGPDGLKRFVDACHRAGLAVVLDVVYNHLGPSGNYLTRFAPYLMSGSNEWGDLVNLDAADSGPVRRFIIDNALMWLTDYHVDGLRLDAVHALKDASDPHLLAELAREVDAAATRLDRPLTLIAETDQNDAMMVTPLRGRRPRHERAMGRRRPPRTARVAHRRAPRVLRRLRLARGAGQGADLGVLPRRHVLDVPRAHARTPGRSGADARASLRRRAAEPRPGRQPRGRRTHHRADLARAGPTSAPC